MVGRGCSVIGLGGSDGVLFVESDPVRNDGVDAHRARGAVSYTHLTLPTTPYV